MASNKQKLLIGGLVVVAGIAAMVGVANAAPKKKDKLPKPEGENEIFPAEEAGSGIETEHEDDVIAVSPGPDGSPGGGAAIVVNTDDNGEPTAIDEKLADVATQDGKTPAQAVAEVVETVTQGQGVSPIAKEETTITADPLGTVGLARMMLARETMPGWKNDLQSEIAVWQQRTGLADVDGKFGIKSAARMAEDVGLLPLIRFWPKTVATKKQAEAAYDKAIGEVVSKLHADLPDAQAQIDALTRSMMREQAQSFGAKDPKPQPTLEFAQIVTDEIAKKAEQEGAAV